MKNSATVSQIPAQRYLVVKDGTCILSSVWDSLFLTFHVYFSVREQCTVIFSNNFRGSTKQNFYGAPIHKCWWIWKPQSNNQYYFFQSKCRIQIQFTINHSTIIRDIHWTKSLWMKDLCVSLIIFFVCFPVKFIQKISEHHGIFSQVW